MLKSIFLFGRCNQTILFSMLFCPSISRVCNLYLISFIFPNYIKRWHKMIVYFITAGRDTPDL